MWPFDESKQLPPLPSKALLHDRSLPPLPPEAQHAEGMAYKPAAFLSLPNELLDRIFLLSISTSFPVEDLDYPRHPLFSKGASFTGNSACHAPHLLASVLSQTCRRFRSLLLHSPLLWSYIFVTRPAPIRSPRSSTSAPTQPSPFIETHGLDKWLSWLPRYISHSQNTPLHIVLDTTRYPLHHSMSGLEGNETPVHPFRYIAATSERWNSLTILTFHLGSQSLPPTLSLLAHVSVPNLENFRVAADIWRDGISSHGDLPPFFVKGAPKLESLIIRDDLDAALRLIKPPPCPYLDEGEDGDQRLQAFSRNEQFDWRSHNSSRIPSPTPSESSSSSDTTVDRPIRTAKYKVELTPIRLVALKHLEIGLHRPQANCKQASSTTPARFLHLFSTPRLASFVITNIRWAEWVTFADMVGLPEDPTSFIQDGRGLREGSGTRGASSTYPLLQHLDINFCD